MNKHTPGPWEVVENGGRMVGVMSRHEWVTYKAGQDRMSTEELEANARLIAAAPDLLAALELMTNVYAAMRESLSVKYASDGWSAETLSIDQARAAIAKATQ